MHIAHAQSPNDTCVIPDDLYSKFVVYILHICMPTFSCVPNRKIFVQTCACGIMCANEKLMSDCTYFVEVSPGIMILYTQDRDGAYVYDTLTAAVCS